MAICSHCYNFTVIWQHNVYSFGAILLEKWGKMFKNLGKLFIVISKFKFILIWSGGDNGKHLLNNESYERFLMR